MRACAATTLLAAQVAAERLRPVARRVVGVAAWAAVILSIAILAWMALLGFVVLLHDAARLTAELLV